MTVDLLRKLQKRGVGVNCVEFFAKKNLGDGNRRELRRRRRTIQLVMKGKLEDAVLQLSEVGQVEDIKVMEMFVH